VKNINDPADTRGEYTCHYRLNPYGAWRELSEGKSVEVGMIRIDKAETTIRAKIADYER